jgi:pimeloyl-ACP methyl ester carboxylesterase
MDLADGRRLAYTVTGPADGYPVLYCHGAIGTPVSATIDLEALTAELGIRYVAPSRPGIGGSDPDPGRSILSFAADARELVEHLGVEHFSVVGVSAGGPYALALSHALRSRVRRVAVVSSLSPLCAPHATPGLARRIRLPLSTLADHPVPVRRLGNALLPLLGANPAWLSQVISACAAPSERARLASATERLGAAAAFFDSCSGGVGGLIDDYGVYAASWGFDPAEVYSPVDLWHGVADPLVPVQHALSLAAVLPHCETFLDPEEGHHFFRARLAVILERLVSRTPAPRGRPAGPDRATEARVRRTSAPARARRAGAARPGWSPDPA